MPEKIKIACTKFGVWFIYARSPLESFSTTRELVPALRGISIMEWVDESYDALAQRFAHLL